MRKSRFTEEQIIKVLKEHAAGLSAGELCRKYGISDATFYKWRSRYGGMEISDARKLKALEDENRKLKKLLAETMLDASTLKEMLEKTSDAQLAETCCDLGCPGEGLIATGRPVAAISNPRNEDEEQKQLLTLLAEGAPIILIDNVDRPLGSDVLCTVLSEESWTKRILGVSQSVTVFTNALMMTTGNNLVFEGDITRRVIMAMLDAGMEHPEKRKFEVDLKAHVLKNRPKLVHAGLTLLRAHIAAGYPGKAGLQPFGNFEQWSDTVRAALVWLGESDPVRTRKFIEADDPAREAATKLFRAIWDDRGDEWFKASELCSEMATCSDDTLARAVEGVIPPRVTSEERALGRYLKQQQGRICDRLRLCSGEDKRAKVHIYRIQRV